jgi:DNA replication protein DnaC
MRERLPDRNADCDTHGQFAAHHLFGDRWTSCPKCAEEERQLAEEQNKQRERQRKREAMLNESGLVGRYLSATFDDFDAPLPAQAKVLQTCREYAASVATGSGGLWLIGPPGTGKTHLGSAIVRHVIEQRDRWAAIFSGRQIVRMLRATWGKREDERIVTTDWCTPGWATNEDALIQELGRIGLLVIDEIGASFGSESEKVQLFDVIDLRYTHRLPTVLLSNLPAKGLKDAIGDRAYDRLREGATVLPCNWDSYRGKLATAKPALQAVKP